MDFIFIFFCRIYGKNAEGASASTDIKTQYSVQTEVSLLLEIIIQI